MSTKKLTTNENSERHLTEGANILMKEFKTPATLLEFITRSFYWLEVYSTSRKDDGQPYEKNTYPLQLMIEEIVQPWLRNNRDVIKEISAGIKSLWQQSFYEGYIEYVSAIMQGFAIEMYEGPFVNGKMKEYLLSINTMYEIGFCIEAYEHEMNEIKKQKKLSEAA